MKVWRRTVETLAFFQKRREWRAFQPQGTLAVVSDFTGDNAFMSGEVLNLLNRRQTQFQVMERSRALSAAAPGLKTILWLHKEPPQDEQLAKLLAFVRDGGIVIAATYWRPAGVTPTTKDPALNYKVYNIGQGQIAVTVDGFNGPYQVAGDAHLLASRRHDLVRLYNPATTNCHMSIDPVHQRQLVQGLNYSPSPADYVTVWDSTHSRQAQYWSPAEPNARPMAGRPADPGTEFDLATLTVNCALEFESSPAGGGANIRKS